MSAARRGDCVVCGTRDPAVAYEGPVRRGVFGQFLEGRILQCSRCGLQWLVAAETLDLEQYKTSEYRERVGEKADAGHYFAVHDREQFEKVGRMRDVLARGAVVADVGCAGGAFLDFVSGIAARTIAVEPAEFYHASLRERGHEVFPTAADLQAPAADLATSFSVIEHVGDPVAFAASMRKLLKPGGWAVLSTPNRRDILMSQGPGEYKSFFYRQVHLYYFDAMSLTALMERAGFIDVRIEYMHRFGFANFAAWLRERRPTGSQGSPLGDAFDSTWRTTLETEGQADYLYVFGRKPADAD